MSRTVSRPISSILVDPENRQWPYEMFVLRESWIAVKGSPPQGNGYYRYHSKDGKSWQRVGGKVKGPMTGDLCFFYKVGKAASLPGRLEGLANGIPHDGVYVAYYRLGAPGKPTDHMPVYEDFPRRSCYRAVSRDGNHWTKDPLMVLTNDERDHRDTQYQECVPLRVPGGYIGIITMYNPLLQTFHLRMAASRDGRQWWFPDRRPCFANAPLGDYGGGMIWQSQNLIPIGDRLYAYYGATEGPHRQISDTRAPSKKIGYQESVIDHGATFIPFNSALCRASWDRNRMYALASSAGGPTIGRATTKDRDLNDGELWLNLRTRPAKKSSQPNFHQGQLQVELLDADGQAMPGFSRGDCKVLTGDHRAVRVKWMGGDKATARARKARFYLRRTFLYGFEFRGLAKATAQLKPGKIELHPYHWTTSPYTRHRETNATRHDDGLCIDLRAPWFGKGERLILRTSEIVGFDTGYLYDDHFPTQEQNGRGKDYKHIRFHWNTERAPDELSADCKVPGKDRFQLRLTARQDYVDISLSVRNDLNRAMKYVDWYFCPVAYEAASINDPTQQRTWLFDGKRLRTLAEKIRGLPAEEMYLVGGPRGSGGFIPPLHAAHPRGVVEAKSPIVVVQNVFGTHAVAIAFERRHSIFSSQGNGCFHADPYFGQDIKSGEKRTVRGRLYLAQGSPQDIVTRFQRDFPGNND